MDLPCRHRCAWQAEMWPVLWAVPSGLSKACSCDRNTAADEIPAHASHSRHHKDIKAGNG
jgi:hypothetical protein